MLQLKLILKRNPQKNIKLAKKFFTKHPGDPNELLDYDYQVKNLYHQMSHKKFSLSLIQVDPEKQVCFDGPQWEEFRFDLFYLKIKLKRNPKSLNKLLNLLLLTERSDGKKKLNVTLDMSLNNCSCNRKVYLSSIKNIYQVDKQKRISFCLKEEEVEGSWLLKYIVYHVLLC